MELQSTSASFPGLASLGLLREAWETLVHQGSLCAENGRTGTVHKLRFRMDGKQHSRYVGKAPDFVEQIRRELTELQAGARSRNRLRQLEKEALQRLRVTKQQLEPLLAGAGRVFHGRAIRRQRQNETGVCGVK